EVVLARMLGLELYGLLVLIRAFVDILNSLFDFGVWETATKYVGTFLTQGNKDKTKAMIKLSYVVDISSGLFAFFIVYLSANIASEYIIKSPESAPLVSIYALSLLISTSNKTSDALFRVFDRFKTMVLILTFQNFIRLMLVIIVLYMGMGLEGVLISFIIASFLGFSMRIWSVTNILNQNEIKNWWSVRLGIIKQHFKEIAWFLANTSFNATIRMTADNFLGVLVLGYIAGKEAVAFYKVARSVVKVLTSIADPLYETIYPELVRILSSNQINEYKSIVKYAAKNLMKITAPIAAVIIIFSDTILSLIFGNEYIPAKNTVRIITLAIIISQPIFWISPSLLAFGRSGLKNLINSSCAVFYILLLLLLVPTYSYNGAAGALLGYHVIITVVSLIVIRHVYKKQAEII
nr:oligosaccharide flippase family protein [Candidatus Dadabacteria bacterium]NIQ15139.1 oligosaccharide flippase family protein [Candidatus Dadabacteria bacterium]